MAFIICTLCGLQYPDIWKSMFNMQSQFCSIWIVQFLLSLFFKLAIFLPMYIFYLPSRSAVSIYWTFLLVYLYCFVGGIVALGKFDALHTGHRELVIQASKAGSPFLLSFVGIAEVLGWESRCTALHANIWNVYYIAFLLLAYVLVVLFDDCELWKVFFSFPKLFCRMTCILNIFIF